MKPVVQIKDCYVYGDRLMGTVVNHPAFPTGTFVTTSPIVKHHSTRLIETRNTTYEVQNWKVPD